MTIADDNVARPTWSPSRWKPSLHKFGDPVSVPANPALDRRPQTERTCSLCGAVKVTVHPREGGGWREWRVSASSAQVTTEPPCVVGEG
jgi:hypothetical protein